MHGCGAVRIGRSDTLIAALLMTLGGASIVQGQAPAPLTTSALAEKPLGKLTGKRDAYGRGDTVTVVVSDVNPFLYEVRLRYVTKAITESALAAFVKLGWGAALSETRAAAAGEAEGMAVAPRLTDSRAPLVPACNASVAALTRELALLRGDSPDTKVTTKVAAGVRHVRMLANSLRPDSTKLLDPKSNADTVRDAARNIVGTLTRLNSAPRVDLGQELSDAQDWLQQRHDNVVVLKQQLTGCTPNQSELLQKMLDLIDRRISALFEAQDAYAKLRERYAAYEALGAAVMRVVADPTTQQLKLHLGPYARSTEVTLILERRAAGSDGAWTKLDSAVFIFGDSQRFSVGFGLVWSPQPRETWYARTDVTTLAAKSLTAAKVTDTTATVQVASRAAPRITPMVTLDYRLPARVWKCDIPHELVAVTGVGYRIAGSTIDLENLEYFVGFGGKALDERFMLSAGWLFSRRAQLYNVAVGDSVAVGTTVIPTTTSFEGKFTVMLGIRFP